MGLLKHCLALLAAGNAVFTVAAAGSHNFSQVAIDNGEALSQLAADALRAARALNQGFAINSTCSPDKVQVRKEW